MTAAMQSHLHHTKSSPFTNPNTMSLTNLSSLTESLESFCQSPSIQPSNSVHTLIHPYITTDAADNNAPKNAKVTFETIYNIILPHLNDMENTIKRTNAYHILLYLISEKVPFAAKRSAQDNITTWLQERISDDMSDCISPLLKIFQAIVLNWDSVPDDAVLRILNHLFETVPVQSLNISERRLLFVETIPHLVDSRPHVISHLDFMTGFIQCIDGERDPLILHTMFQLFPKIAECAPESVDQNAEELFDIFSCYFPVNLNSQRKGPYGITRESLAENLLKTLAARPSFAEHALPFFEEKISSAIVDSKVEALNAVAFCIGKYGEECLRGTGAPGESPLVDMWNIIRTEMTRSSPEKEVHHAAINAITNIARVVSTEALGEEQSLQNVQPMLQPAIQEIRSPECRMAKQYSEMIAAVAASSQWNCQLATHSVIPQIYQLFLEVRTTPKRSAILIIGMQLLSTLIFYPALVEASNLAVEKMWEIAYSLRDDYNLKMEIIDVMSRLTLFERMSDTDEPSEYLILSLSNGDDAECARALTAIDWMFNNAGKEEIVRDEILASIISSIEDTEGSEEMSSTNTQRLVHVVCQIGLSCPSLVPKCVSDLFEQVENRANKPGRTPSTAILDALLELVKSSGSQLESSAAQDYIIRSAKMIAPMRSSKSDDPSHVPPLVTKLSALCSILYKQSNDEIQEQVAQVLLHALTGPFSESLTLHLGFSSNFMSTFFPFKSRGGHEYFLYFTCRVLLSMRQSVLGSNQNGSVLDFDLSAVVSKLLDYCMNTPKTVVKANPTSTTGVSLFDAALHFVCALLNKSSLDQVHPVIEQKIEPLISSLAVERVEQEQDLVTITIFSWLLKALIMRPDVTFICAQINEKMQKLLTSSVHDVAFAAARAYGIVMSEHVLTRETDVNSTIFFRQKFYTMNISSLLERYNELEEARRGPILEAVGNLIQSLPTSVLIGQINELYPLVYAAIRSENLDVIQSGLNTLRVLLSEAEKHCESHLSEIIPVLLSLSAEKRERMKIRMDALRCLQELVEYEYSKVYPHQEDVLRGLRKALGDHKRAVRHEAVVARNRWFTLNQ